MTVYTAYNVGLTQAQKDAIVNAVKNKQSVTLRLAKEQLEGDVPLPLTARQVTHIQKNLAKGIGSQITLSKTQLRKVRSGGFLGALMAIAAPFIVKSIVKAVAKKSGHPLSETSERILDVGVGALSGPAGAVTGLALGEAGRQLQKVSKSPAEVFKGDGIVEDAVNVAKKIVKNPTVRKVSKVIAKEGAKIGCQLAGAAISKGHPIAGPVVQRVCEEGAKAVLGDGQAPKRKRKSRVIATNTA